MTAWVLYIVECCDGSLYTGITTELKRRLAMHNAGSASRYTRSRRPVRVRYTETCASHSAALKRELVIKKMRAAEKRALCAQ